MNKNIYNKKYLVDNWFEFQLDSKYITDLIVQIDDATYTKKCIKEKEKLGLGSSCIVKLIVSLNDIEYMKKCIKNREKLRLASYHVCKIIKEINDKDYIIKCIKNRKELGLSPYYVAELIKFTNDSEYVLSCIENCKENNLGSYVITKLIEFINNIEYTKQCIENAKKIGLSNDDMTYLIKSTNDVNYIDNYIKNGILYGLNSKNIVDLIIYIKDREHIKKYIKNYKKSKSNPLDIYNLILMTQDRKYIKRYISHNEKLKSEEINNLKLATNRMYINKEIDKYNILKLPKNMTIGMEIEMVGIYSDMIKNSAIDLDNWEIKEDDTIKEEICGEKGIEIISPILNESNEKNTRKIVRTLRILQLINQHVNKSCGGHIHIGCEYLKNSRAYINLLEIWCKAEYIFYIIGNKEGEIPRGIEYSSPISKVFDRKLNKNINLEDMKRKIVKIQGTRAKSINFINILPNAKKTIEFRLSNGTLEPDVWIQNINLYGNIIVVAQQLSEIQEKGEKNRTNDEEELLKLFTRLKNEKNEKIKLEILLDLLIKDENDKKIYRNRYKANNKLLKNNKNLNALLKSKISEDGIVLIIKSK